MARSRDGEHAVFGQRQRAGGGNPRVSAPALSTNDRTGAAALETELRVLFHRLNNQLGIILAHAELLELTSPDELQRARASQIVATALEAMGTSREIGRRPGSELA